MVMRLGMIGVNDGNGHPFSFSAIINGYKKDAFAELGWPVILDYLEKQDEHAIGFEHADVVCAWTQHNELTKKLCNACHIQEAMTDWRDMLREVDAVVIARDDVAVHKDMASFFLDSDIPVFVDKPLCINQEDLNYFETYLRRGLLMSTSGLRYAAELDQIRVNGDVSVAAPLHITAVTINNWMQYGIHILDALAGLGFSSFTEIMKISNKPEHLVLIGDNIRVTIACLGKIKKEISLNISSEKIAEYVRLDDNFTAFRRCLLQFITMVQTGKAVIPAEETMRIMDILRVGLALKPGETKELQSDYQRVA